MEIKHPLCGPKMQWIKIAQKQEGKYKHEGINWSTDFSINKHQWLKREEKNNWFTSIPPGKNAEFSS
jgi:hypothetical protein